MTMGWTRHRRTAVLATPLAAALLAAGAPAPLLAAGPPWTQTTYGYRRGEDPLVRHLRALVAHSREGTWDHAATDLEELLPPLRDVKELFGVDLRPELEHAVASKDVSEVLEGSVRLIILAILEKFVSNEREELDDRPRGKERLRIAEEYYTTVLSGN